MARFTALGFCRAAQALDNKGAVEYWYASGFISRDTYDGLLKHCNFSATGEEATCLLGQKITLPCAVVL